MSQHGFKQAVDHELLVEDGQLDGDARQFGEVPGRRDIEILLVPVVLVDELVTMHSIGGENDHYGEIGNQQGDVEGVPAVEMLETSGRRNACAGSAEVRAGSPPERGPANSPSTGEMQTRIL